MVVDKSRLMHFFVIFLTLSLIFFHFSSRFKEEDGWKNAYWNWVTSQNVKYSKNWYFEGPLNLKFAKLENPPSIEFNSLLDRVPFNSYPPGYLFPTYFVSKIIGNPPSHEIAHNYLFFMNFVIGILLSAISYLLFSKHIQEDYLVIIFSIIPGAIHFTNPGVFFILTNKFAHDIAVLFPFTLFLFLEILKDNGMSGPKFIFSHSFVMFYGVFTEWIFVFLVAITYIKRLALGDVRFSRKKFFKDTFYFWLPAFIALFIWCSLTLYHGNQQRLDDHILKWAFFNPKNQGYLLEFPNLLEKMFSRIGGPLLHDFFKISMFLYIFSILYYLYFFIKYRDRSIPFERIIFYGLMVLVPFITHTFLFPRHANNHVFSSGKLTLVITLIPFVILNLIVLLLFSNNRFFKRRLSAIFHKSGLFLCLFSVIVSGFLVWNSYSLTYDTFYKLHGENSFYVGQAEFIQRVTTYGDVCFSMDYVIDINPPQRLSYTEKRVYYVNPINPLTSVCNKVTAIKGEYIVNLVSVLSENPDSFQIRENFKSSEFTLVSSKEADLNIFKIGKSEFSKYCTDKTF